jgi:hypothetical protein
MLSDAHCDAYAAPHSQACAAKQAINKFANTSFGCTQIDHGSECGLFTNGDCQNNVADLNKAIGNGSLTCTQRYSGTSNGTYSKRLRDMGVMSYDPGCCDIRSQPLPESWYVVTTTNCSHDVPALVAFLGCTPVSSVNATWVMKEVVGIAKDVSYTYGVSHAYAKENTAVWARSATTQVSSGFSFYGFGIKFEVTGTTSSGIAQSTSQTFEEYSATTVTTHYQPGVVWQFQFNSTDHCGLTSIFTDQLTQTNNLASPPCCLPGYFQDPRNATGPCVASSDGKVFDLCKRARH